MLVNGYLVRDGTFLRVTKTLRNEVALEAVPVVLEYLAEGNANVVYRVVLFWLASQWLERWSPLSVENVVLRLSKQKNLITSTSQRKLELEKEFSFIPKKYLLEQTLVLVEKDVIETINRDLLDHERSGRRPPARHGDPVTLEDNHGVFLTDMTAMGTDTVLQFKPKWLLQSPNAPADSVRCRTCALRAQRQAANKQGLTLPPGATWCPLALVSGDKEERQAAAAAILKANACDWLSDGASQLADLFASHSLLALLRQHQMRLDPHGILESLSEGKDLRDLCIAMTIRDCTLFIKSCNGKFDEKTEMKLADLDMKASKVDKWADIERRLIDEGWYTNSESLRRPETICVLAHNKDDEQA